MPTPRRRPIAATTSRAAASPSWASSVTSAPVIRRPAASTAAERGVRARSCGHSQALAAERGAGGERLQAAAVRAVARARRPVGVDDHVAELAGRADAPADEHAVDQDAAADAGAEREHHGVAGTRAPRRSGARRAARRWRRCRSRPAARAARRSGRGPARPRAAGGSWTARRRARGRSATASRGRSRAPCRPPPRAPRRRRRRGRRAPPAVVPPRPRRKARWCTWRPASTTPARSFVPPRSTPITQPGGHVGHHTQCIAGHRDRSEAPDERPVARRNARSTAATARRPRLFGRDRGRDGGSLLDELRGRSRRARARARARAPGGAGRSPSAASCAGRGASSPGS